MSQGKLLVEIFMDGGVIQDARYPEGVEVVVYDYDIEGCEDEDELHTDDNGDLCYRFNA